MAIDSDILLDRANLKKRITKWQLIALCVGLVAIFVLAKPSGNSDVRSLSNIKGDYIARVEISGVITDDYYRSKILKELREDKNLKGVILAIDSPGGTTSGGEELYHQIRKISEAGKPVVVSMKTLATSAGYMTAIAADQLIARNGSITGSIGVLVQSMEATELAKNIGIKLESFKSSPLKANPSPTEKTEPAAARAMTAAVLSFYDYFVELVAERRGLDLPTAKKIADGRVFTGRQALKLGLIDKIGGEDEALEWLQQEKQIADTVKVIEISVIEPENNLGQLLFGKNSAQMSLFDEVSLKGLLAIWSPNL